MSHGRAVMPFGKHRGVAIRLLPDSYLSNLADFMTLAGDASPHVGNSVVDGRKCYCNCDQCRRQFAEKFWWVKESLLAELRHRGLVADRANEPDAAVPDEPPSVPPSSKRAYRL
jgi:hypothetical protein